MRKWYSENLFSMLASLEKHKAKMMAIRYSSQTAEERNIRRELCRARKKAIITGAVDYSRQVTPLSLFK